MEAGTWGEWAGAIAGAGAIIVALATTARERSRSQKNIEAERELTREALALDRRRFEADTFERLAWQAKHVTLTHPDCYESPEGVTFVVTCRNPTDSPIYSLRAFIKLQGVLKVGTERLLALPDNVFNVDCPTGLRFDVDQVKTMGVVFRDAAGVEWARYVSGHLVRIEGPPHDFLESDIEKHLASNDGP